MASCVCENDKNGLLIMWKNWRRKKTTKTLLIYTGNVVHLQGSNSLNGTLTKAYSKLSVTREGKITELHSVKAWTKFIMIYMKEKETTNK